MPEKLVELLAFMEANPEYPFSLRELARHYGCDVWIRYVVVKGVNDSLRDIEKICRMANAYPNIKKIQLLPYHNMGREKYKKLGISYTLSKDNVPSRQQMTELESIVNDNFHP